MGREFQVAYTLPKIMFSYMQSIASAEGMNIQKLSRAVIMDFINSYIQDMKSGSK